MGHLRIVGPPCALACPLPAARRLYAWRRPLASSHCVVLPMWPPGAAPYGRPCGHHGGAGTGSSARLRRGGPPAGTLDEDGLDRLLAVYAGRVALLAVSGASNVTGVVQPVHRLAEKVHAVGGRILVDAAQLAAHRPIDMRAHDDPSHLDFVALSAHKMYAPFGTGALIGRRDSFRGRPDHAGGGTIRAVTVDDVAWADLPDREEAGGPNVVGAVALAAAMRALREIGLDRIAAHEAEITRYAMDRLAGVPGVTLHGPTGASESVERDAADILGTKVGVIPFTVDGLEHGLVAAVLGYEHGVGVRHGCFCAQP